ncbi:unconventional myosin-XVIIIa-like [Asparagus officinalis]|uniref:unconventional myosin-XVIIIa-like n=1 Tax=Asparagus officinalis TaxID=4686 RepID=UPI00098E11CC|nr:unconventional myosin-XVIIIa-like [Asparagus officinalis]
MTTGTSTVISSSAEEATLSPLECLRKRSAARALADFQDTLVDCVKLALEESCPFENFKEDLDYIVFFLIKRLGHTAAKPYFQRMEEVEEAVQQLLALRAKSSSLVDLASNEAKAEDERVALEQQKADNHVSRLSSEVENLKQVIAKAQASLAIQEKAHEQAVKELEDIGSRRQLAADSIEEKDRALREIKETVQDLVSRTEEDLRREILRKLELRHAGEIREAELMAPNVKKVTSKKRKETSSSSAAEAVAAEDQEETPTAEEQATEPILISDDESEGAATSSESKPAPTPDAEPCLEMPPITALAPGQEPISSDSSSLQARLEEFENAVKQVISLVSLGMGSFDGFRQSLLDRVVNLRRSGENWIAKRCMQKLRLLESRMMRLETLLREGPEVDMESFLVRVRRREAWDQEVRSKESFLVRVRRREAWDQEVRSKEIAYLETNLASWVGQQHLLGERIGDATSTVARLKTELGEAESSLRKLQSERAKVDKVVEEKTRNLFTLREEDTVTRSSFEGRVRQEAEDKAREDHAGKIAAAKVDLASFSLLD